MTDQMKVAIIFVTAFLVIVISLTFFTMKQSKSITEKSIDIRREQVAELKETNRLLKKLIALIETHKALKN